METCEITVGSTGFGKWTETTPCGKPVKYLVTYRGARGNVTEKLCGVHFRAAEKRAATLKKRGINLQLVSEAIA